MPDSPASGVSAVTHIVAVASGKGGVGKSTVSANLAVALSARGLRVGLLDADIYGPSVPLMFGVPSDEKPRVNEAREVVPLVRYGVSLLSMGFLMDDRSAVIWRGPMVSSAIRQFLGQAEWGALDVLVLDDVCLADSRHLRSEYLVCFFHGIVGLAVRRMSGREGF